MTKYTVTLNVEFDLYYDADEKIFDELKKLIKKMISENIDMGYTIKGTSEE